MLIIRRKNIVIGLLVVLLVITGYLNFVYNQNNIPAVHSGEPKQDEEKEDEALVTVSDIVKPGDVVDGASRDAVATSATSFFIDYRFERERTRSKEVAYITTIVDHPKSDAETIKEAQQQLLEITGNMEKEMAIETLIKSKGFSDVVAIIHQSNVSVIVDKPELEPEEVAQILEIVRAQSGERAENIRIIPKL